jgi:hypothetical protein
VVHLEFKICKGGNSVYSGTDYNFSNLFSSRSFRIGISSYSVAKVPFRPSQIINAGVHLETGNSAVRRYVAAIGGGNDHFVDTGVNHSVSPPSGL